MPTQPDSLVRGMSIDMKRLVLPVPRGEPVVNNPAPRGRDESRDPY